MDIGRGKSDIGNRVNMTNKQSGFVKIAGGLLAIIVSTLAIISFANMNVDKQIDSKIIEHEAVFESKQQKDMAEVKKNVAVIEQKVDDIKDDVSDNKKMLEQLVKDR